MVEASGEEKKRRVMEEERKRVKRGGVFKDSEQLYKACNDSQRNKTDKSNFAAVPERTSCLSNTSTTNLGLRDQVDNISDRVNHSYQGTNGDRYMMLTENTSVTELPPGDSSQEATPTLTWSSTLTRTLDSPCFDPEVSAPIRARARG